MKKILIILGIAVLFILLVALGLKMYKFDFNNQDEVPESVGKTDYRNATYIINDQTITLKNGVAESDTNTDSESKTITQYFGNEAKGDLNGDGLDDVAFLLTQNSGGSGTFYYIAVALANSQGYKGLNALLLGDRIAPQTTEINKGSIIVNYADRQIGAPMTDTPSIGVSKYFNVTSGALAPISAPSELITVDNIRPEQVITSPLVIEGTAKGNWFFEASFPIKLYDENGRLIATAIAQAQSDWMTENLVPFKAEMSFSAGTSTSGVLVLEKDNPSGLPENAGELRLPVKFVGLADKIKVKVYFNNDRLDPEVTCTKVFAVEREPVKTPAIAQAALTELLTGTTADEQKSGFITSINPGVKIQSLSIVNGVAKVDFNEQLQAGVGGSCRVAAIRAQITETLKQFLSVSSVIISINGRTEDILQP